MTKEYKGKLVIRKKKARSEAGKLRKTKKKKPYNLHYIYTNSIHIHISLDAFHI